MYSHKQFKTAPCRAENVFQTASARIQFITSRMIRLEWNADGIFEDRQTLAVVNRDTGKVDFSVLSEGRKHLLRGDALEIRYTDDGKAFSADNLKVSFLVNNAKVEWTPGKADTGNLGATIRTLDGIDGGQRNVQREIVDRLGEKRTINTREDLDLGKGYISRSGWSLVDDSENIVIDLVEGKKWVTPRPAGERQDLYLLAYGHDYIDALADAAKVFGGQPLPPRYTLGYWWSRYWAYSDEQIEELVRSFDKMNTPIDVMVIDMDWHLEGWTGYTWDRRYFPDPDEHLAWLHRHGVKVTLNLHPADGVAKFEDQFEDMANAMGLDPEKVSKVEFDITDPKYMENYFRILHHPEEKRGIDFWWMDWQQGLSTAMPGLDTLPWINQLHWEDMEDRPDRQGKRPLIFSRFGGYGAGRYTIGFSGDTYSTWDSLAFQPYFTATASNVLYGYWSHDIGGHMPGAIEPELYTRWIQYGMYSPILRTHTTKNPEAERRVWEYPAPYSDIMQDTIRARYELVPYIYSENRKAFDSGISLCRPMYYSYPELDDAYQARNQYMFGDCMLAAPVATPVDKSCDMAEVRVWLPEGMWFDTARGVMERGGKTITRHYLIDEIPVFVRPGTVIPSQSCPKRLDDRYYRDLVMTVYPGDEGNYDLYEDDGISTAYLRDEYAVIAMSHRREGKTRIIKVGKRSGGFSGYQARRSLTVRLEASTPPVKVLADGVELKNCYRLDEVGKGWSYKGKSATLVIKLDSIDLDTGAEIRVSYADEQSDGTLADGARGLFSRLERVNFYNTLLSGCHILHPDERLGQELSHAAYRISRKPETFTREMENIYKRMNDLATMLAELGASWGRWGSYSEERIVRSQTAVNILRKSGYLG